MWKYVEICNFGIRVWIFCGVFFIGFIGDNSYLFVWFFILLNFCKIIVEVFNLSVFEMVDVIWGVWGFVVFVVLVVDLEFYIENLLVEESCLSYLILLVL